MYANGYERRIDGYKNQQTERHRNAYYQKYDNKVSTQAGKYLASSQIGRWNQPRTDKPSGAFKGSSLVTTLIAQNPIRFKNRISAKQFAQNLFREGKIRGVFAVKSFEDSDQLYIWQNENAPKNIPRDVMVSSSTGSRGRETKHNFHSTEKVQFTQNQREGSSVINAFFKELEKDFPETKRENPSFDKSGHFGAVTPWSLQPVSTTSSESSVDAFPQAYTKYKDKTTIRSVNFVPMAAVNRDHDAIPEESSIDRIEGNSLEIDMDIPRTSEQMSSRRWNESQYCYSDNEKQLIEEMKRMKRDHNEIVRTYEDRVNKLMTKMHELRGIAEMLENSSTKSSPYGILPGKNSILNFLDREQRQEETKIGQGLHVPPPLPPRPGRDNRVYPNKPIVRPIMKMKLLEWTRIILTDTSSDGATTIWHSMLEPKIDTKDIERLFQSSDNVGSESASLYDSVVTSRGGRTNQQLVTILEREKSGRIAFTMKSLHCSITDFASAISTLDISAVNSDRLAELMELFGTSTDVDKITNYVKRKGLGNLDHPEFLLFEMSKIEHFRERVDFLRFRYRIQWNLFEIDQQLRELHTACDEITNSLALKNLLETLLAIGNYLNGGSPFGQADGFNIDILNKLKEIQDRDGKGNLLEYVMKMYCHFYEVEIDIGCPTKFRLPEPSNMRHAAQVSFDTIQESLGSLLSDIKTQSTMLFEQFPKTEGSQQSKSYRTTAENFFTSATEVIADEEKLLRDTQQFFDKTKSYFTYGDNQCGPQAFFQIWAMFLHDCKYYWKLAHRKIAKDRFEFEFKYKGQLSVNAAHGYDSFRASMLRRLTMLRGGSVPEKTSVFASPSSKSVNHWINFVENCNDNKPSVPPLPLKDINQSQKNDLEVHKSPSPKPLTSEPPASLHKPQAKTPASNGQKLHNGVPGYPPNYENQKDMESVLNSSRSDILNDFNNDRPPMPLPGGDVQQLKSPDKPFSIKSWLKREPGRRHNSGESKSSNENKQMECETSAKRPNVSATTFSKLRNSVVQKFTGANSNVKRPNQLSVHTTEMTEPLNRYTENIPEFTPLEVITDGEIDPYMTSLERNIRYGSEATKPDNQHREFQSAERNPDSRWAVGRRVAKVRNGSDISTEYAALYHTPPFTTQTTIDKDGYASPNIIRPFPKSDVNNNDNGESGYGSSDRNSNQRKRVPIVLGSNTSISDAYKQTNGDDQGDFGRINFDKTPDHRLIPKQSGNTAPMYKPINSNNFENNGKLENSTVANQPKEQFVTTSRQQAEPMKPSIISRSDNKFDQPDSLPFTDRYQQQQKQQPQFATPQPQQQQQQMFRPNTTGGRWTSTKPETKHFSDTPLSSRHPDDRQKPMNLGRAYQRQQLAYQHSQQEKDEMNVQKSMELNFPRSEIPPQKPPRTPQMQRSTGRFKNPNTSGSRDDLRETPSKRERSAQNSQNISSLISKFEKPQNSLDSQRAVQNENLMNNKTMAMTSTPVTERRPLTLGDEDEEDPPPLPPRHDPQSAQFPEPLHSASKIARNIHPHHQDSPNSFLHSTENKTPSLRAELNDKEDCVLPQTQGYLQQYNASSNHYRPQGVESASKIKPIHSRESTGLSENDEGYKDKLRKAANSSVFDRYTKQKSRQPYRHDNENSVPSINSESYKSSAFRYDRQNSQNSNFSSSYNRQNNSSLQVPPQHIGRQSNISTAPQYIPKSAQKMNHMDAASHDNSAHASRSMNPSDNSTMAVVKPTILQQGSLAFMAI